MISSSDIAVDQISLIRRAGWAGAYSVGGLSWRPGGWSRGRPARNGHGWCWSWRPAGLLGGVRWLYRWLYSWLLRWIRRLLNRLSWRSRGPRGSLRTLLSRITGLTRVAGGSSRTNGTDWSRPSGEARCTRVTGLPSGTYWA